jgi:hypothetical protein
MVAGIDKTQSNYFEDSAAFYENTGHQWTYIKRTDPRDVFEGAAKVGEITSMQHRIQVLSMTRTRDRLRSGKTYMRTGLRTYPFTTHRGSRKVTFIQNAASGRVCQMA